MAKSARSSVTRSVTVKLVGLDKVVARLQQIGRNVPTIVGRALRAEAEIEMTEAKRRVPVLTGTLRASGTVTGPAKGEITVRLSFGGPAAPYALYVHENEEAWHRSGQAKYLESVILESAPHLGNRVAKRIESDMAREANEVVKVSLMETV